MRFATCFLGLTLSLFLVRAPQDFPGGELIYFPVPEPLAGGVTTPFDDADVVWNFNDLADLGADNGDGTLDLTLVNTPEGMGGALGYSMYVGTVDTHAQSVATNITSSGSARTVIAWVDNVTDDTSAGLVSASPTENSSNPLWLLQRDSGNYRVYHGGAMRGSQTGFGTGRHMLSYSTDSSGNWKVALDDATPLTGTNLDAWTGANTYVGAGYTNQSGEKIGPVAIYSADVLSTVQAAFFNSGKGATCEAITAAGLDTNGVSCWNMTEDGGPYVDSWGSNNLTGVNTPTQEVAIVEQPDSRMGIQFVAASSQYAHTGDDVMDLYATDDWTISCWVNNQAANHGLYIMTHGNQAAAGAAGLQVSGLNPGYYTVSYRDGISGTTELNLTSPVAGSIDEWHMLTLRFDTDASTYGDGVLSWDDTTTEDSGSATDQVRDSSTPRFTFGARNTGLAYSDVTFDNCAVWNSRYLTDAEVLELWASGAGLFYSAYWDAIFDGPRFAWSERPEIRRIYVH